MTDRNDRLIRVAYLEADKRRTWTLFGLRQLQQGTAETCLALFAWLQCRSRSPG